MRKFTKAVLAFLAAASLVGCDAIVRKTPAGTPKGTFYAADMMDGWEKDAKRIMVYRLRKHSYLLKNMVWNPKKKDIADLFDGHEYKEEGNRKLTEVYALGGGYRIEFYNAKNKQIRTFLILSQDKSNKHVYMTVKDGKKERYFRVKGLKDGKYVGGKLISGNSMPKVVS